MDLDKTYEHTINDMPAGPISVVYNAGIEIATAIGVGVLDLRAAEGLLMIVVGATRRTSPEQLNEMPTTVVPLSQVYEVVFQP